MMVCGVLTLLMVPASLAASRACRRLALRSLRLPGLAIAVQRQRRRCSSRPRSSPLRQSVLGDDAAREPHARAFAIGHGRRAPDGDVTEDFGLPGTSSSSWQAAAIFRRLLERNETIRGSRCERASRRLSLQAPSALLPSDRTQRGTARAVAQALAGDGRVCGRRSRRPAADAGFRPQSPSNRSCERLPRLTAPTSATFRRDGFAAARPR